MLSQCEGARVSLFHDFAVFDVLVTDVAVNRTSVWTAVMYVYHNYGPASTPYTPMPNY